MLGTLTDFSGSCAPEAATLSSKSFSLNKIKVLCIKKLNTIKIVIITEQTYTEGPSNDISKNK